MHLRRGTPRSIAFGLCMAAIPLSAVGAPQTGPDPMLTLRFRDAGTGQPIAVRVGVFDASQQPLPPPDPRAHVYQERQRWSFFYAEDTVTLAVPAGPARIKLAHGFGYEPMDTNVTVPSDTTITLELERVVAAEALGWYSGDTHVHISHGPIRYELDSTHLRLMARAEDLNFINSLDERDRFSGAIDPLSTADHILFFSKEHKNSDFAHLTILGLKKWISDRGCGGTPAACGRTLNSRIYHELHSQGPGVALIATHPFPTLDLTDTTPWPGGGVWRGMPLDLAAGTDDAMDILCYSHVDPPEGVTHYFQALNAGFRLPPSAGTDAAVSRGTADPPGGYRVFVKMVDDAPFTMDNWIDALLAGRSFVSNYPLITDFAVDGRMQGAVVRHTGQNLPGTVSVRCVVPIDKIEIVGDTGVLDVLTPPPGSARDFTASFEIDPTNLTWVVAVATGFGPSGWHVRPVRELYAQTGPVYLERSLRPGGKGQDPPDIHPQNAIPLDGPRCQAANFFLDMLGVIDSLFTVRGDFWGSENQAAFNAAVANAYDYFYKLCLDPPFAFALTWPPDDSLEVVADPTPTFRWKRAFEPDPGDVVTYRFLLDTRKDLATATVVEGLVEPFFTVTDGLAPGTRYYWRAEAVDVQGLVRLSDPECASFLFDPTATGIGDAPPAPVWAIEAPLPNPFNPAVQVTYHVADAATQHRLDIFDAEGRRVRTLFAGIQEAGVKTEQWYGTNDSGARVASGVYFIRLSPAGSPAVTRKVVLLK